MTTALSTQEASNLRACEQVIRRAANAFREAGQAFRKIRDEKLYRQHYKTFASYCEETFGYHKSHVYRLIEVADTPETSPTGDKIETERQARKLLETQRTHQASGGATEKRRPEDETSDHAAAGRRTQSTDGTEHPGKAARTEAPTRHDAADQEQSGLEQEACTEAEPAVAEDRISALVERFGLVYSWYERTYGDRAEWMCWRAAVEQFSVLKGKD